MPWSSCSEDIKEKGPFVHAQAAAVNRPLLCPGLEADLIPPSLLPSFLYPTNVAFLLFPKLRYREGMTWFVAKVTHSLD